MTGIAFIVRELAKVPPDDYQCSQCFVFVWHAHHPYFPLCLRCGWNNR